MFFGYYNIANLVTLLGLVSSVLACFNAMNGNIKMGVVMFLPAGNPLFDVQRPLRYV